MVDLRLENNESLPAEQIITRKDLATWGLEDLAYVKKSVMDDETVWTIHAAEGTKVASAQNRDIAIALINQNDLVAYSVH